MILKSSRKELDSLLSGEREVVRCIKRYLKKDGSIVWADVGVALRRDGQGKPLYFITTTIDITERKQAEEKLIASEVRYRRLFESAKDGILILDADTGEIVDVNPFLIKMLGYSHSEFLGKQLWEIGLFKDIAANKAHFLKLQQESYLQYRNHPLQAKDGYQIWVEFVSNVYFVNSHKVIQCNIRDITSRKQAEETLLRQAQILEQVHGGIVTTDLDGLIMSWNSGAEKMLGYSSEEVLGKSISLVYPQDQLAILAEEVQPQVRKKGWHESELRFRKKSGEEFPVHITLAALKDASGVVIGMVGSAIDITERKQAEEALRFPASIVESADDAIIGKTQEGIILSWNRGAKELYGYSAHEAIGQPISILAPPEKFNEIPMLLEKVWRGEKVEHYETVRLTRAGKLVDVSLTISPIRDHDGKIVAASTIARNITERKQTEENLAASEAKLRALFAAMTDAVIVLDTDGRYLEIAPTNPANLFRPPEGLLGNTMHEILPKNTADMILSKIHEALQTGKPVSFEYALQIGDREMWFTATASPQSKNTVVLVAHDFTEHQQAEEAIRHHVAELEMLYESGLALGQLLTPKEIGQKAIELMSSKLDWHHISIRLYHQEDETFELLAFNLPDTISKAEILATEEQLKSVRVGEGLCGWAVRHNEVLRLSNLSQDPRYVETASNMHAGLYVPLKVVERVVGVICIESEMPDTFSEADERLMVTLANQAAIALENARLHQDILQQVKRLEALHMIDQYIAASFDQRLTLELLLTHTLDQLEVDAAVILLLEPYQRTLQYAVGKGFHTHIIETTNSRLGDNLAGRAVIERRIIHINDREARELNPALTNLWLEEEFESMDAVPLISKGQVKGVLVVYHRKAFTANPDWSSFFETLAGQAAIALDSMHLFNSLQQANMDLTIAYDATIEGWSQAMDLRDKETEGHTKRVTEMSMQIGKAMQLGEEYLVHLRRGALLHDIGKLGVPDYILLKPDKLTDEEWQIMKKHPQFAYDMLHSVAYLHRALDIPYCHHEKWDGTGYPQGLKAEQIPLAARIFAIVDVWDALTSNRPYREAWSQPDALKYIREQSGKYFDPQVVEIFLNEFGHE